MRFPFILRSEHDEQVKLLRSQIAGLARTLYGGDVPEEFQMLIGIEIPSNGRKPEPKPEPEEQPLTQDQKIEEAEAERQNDVKARLKSILRTRPSQLGPELQRVMKQTTFYTARPVNPKVAMMFDTAKSEALKDK